MTGGVHRQAQDMTETSRKRKRSPNRLPPLDEKALEIGIWSELAIIEQGSVAIVRHLRTIMRSSSKVD